MHKTLFLLAGCFVLHATASSQSLAVNTDASTAHSSALLDVKSTSKGLLTPRMTKAQRNAIASPATGLLVFQTAPDSVGFHYYNGTDWAWLANSSNSHWLLNGNSNTNPPLDYIGTNDVTDLVFKVNGFENMRLSTDGMLGLYNQVPQYALDLQTGAAAVNPCGRNGMRLKPIGLTSNDCDNGLFLGYSNAMDISNVLLWNYANDGNDAQNMILGMNSNEWLRITSSGSLAFSEPSPNYGLDMRVGMAAINPCFRNGLRINVPGNTNECERGLFFGYDDISTATRASIWNFGTGGDATGYEMRFGFGDDDVIGEMMRLTTTGLGIGTVAPAAKLHIINSNAQGLPGVMATSIAAPLGSYGFYSGLEDGGSFEGRIWNYANAGIHFGTNDAERMTITSTGNIGINTLSNPHSTLQVDGTVAIGVTASAITGGSTGFPTLLPNDKSYIPIEPTGDAEYFQLPNPAAVTGRIYYIRNISETVSAQIGTLSGVVCPGNGICLGAGAFYTMPNNSTGKTLFCLSDGNNWILGVL